MRTIRKNCRSGAGAALIIVLAFIVLLAGVMIIFFTQALSYRTQGNSSFNDFKSAALAQSGLETVVGDLEQEIANGSTNYSFGAGTNYYCPTNNAYAIPQRSGTNALVAGVDPAPNLVRISVRTETYPLIGGFTPAVGSRASADSSTNVAASGQFISMPRWNKHYLIPRAMVGSTTIDTTPATNAFSPPDWVYVTSSGPEAINNAIIAAGTPKVIGRYAYAIYDEGGLLDANVVGVPSNMATNSTSDPNPNTSQVVWGSGLKGSEAFADLTVTNAVTQAPMFTQAQINQIVGWRNNASAAQPSGNYASGYTFSSANAAAYHDAMVTSTNGFLTTSGASYVASNQTNTDQVFPSRQSLIAFFNESTNPPMPQDALQYLGTFTRTLEQPSYNPPVGRPMVQSSTTANATTFGTGNDAYGSDRISTAPTTNAPSDINPAFLSVRVTTGGWQRADGTSAVVGEPLVKERFPLSRLTNFPTGGVAPVGIYTDPTSQAGRIYNYFGLRYNGSFGSSPTQPEWLYSHDNNNTAGIDRLAPPPSAPTAGVTLQAREPDFFELLKAAISVGSLGKGSAYNESNNSGDTYTTQGSIGYLTQARDTLSSLQILQIGANIIDQYKSDDFPTSIQFAGDPTVPPNVVCGSQDLPYLYRMRDWILQSSGNTNEIVYLIQPEVWDPYSYNSTAGYGSSGFSTTNRPSSFRVRLEPDPTLSSTASPVVLTNYYQYSVSGVAMTDAVGPATNVSLNATNFVASTSVSPQPNPAPLTFNAGEPTYFGFREPTLLGQVSVPPNSSFQSISTNAPYYVDYNTKATNTGFTIETATLTQPAVNPLASPPTESLVKIAAFPNSEPSCLRVYLDYQNSQNNWVTYDQMPIQYQGGASSMDMHTIYNYHTYLNMIEGQDWYGWVRTDPRTSRWAAQYTEYFYSYPTINVADNQFGSMRADGNISFGSHLGGVKDAGFVDYGGYGKQYRGFQQGYLAENSTRQTYQTDSESGASANLRYYLDADGVPRRAMGGYVTDPADGGTYPATASQPLTGLPMAIGSGSVTNILTGITTPAVTPAYGSRPTMLHRPFRSVAELGYVFRESPWRDIDFSFPESGDSALLDVFCINDTSSTAGLVAGKVDLNTRQAPVLASLLSGTVLDKDNSATPVLTQAQANDIATQLVSRTSNPNSVAIYGPLMSRAALVGTWTGSTYSPTSGANLKTAAAAYTLNPDNFYSGFSHDIGATNIITGGSTSATGTPVALIPRQRDSAMRALVDSGTTRTWNLLIDLVAQSGRFPPKSTGFPNFVVEGEKHYWLHVAIDRYTGKVIASQMEVVRE